MKTQAKTREEELKDNQKPWISSEMHERALGMAYERGRRQALADVEKIIEDLMSHQKADEEYYDAWDTSTMNEIIEELKSKLKGIK